MDPIPPRLQHQRVRRLVLVAVAMLGTIGPAVAHAAPDPILVFSGNTSLSPGETYSSFGTASGRPISSTTTLPRSLAGNACVLLNLNQATFGGPQVATLSDYLVSGGRVLMIGENDNYANNAAFRTLSTALGSSMQIQNNAFDPGFRDTLNVDSDPLTRDVTAINYAYTATVSFSAPARSLVRRSDGTDTIMAAEAIGTGQLVALGDANAFTTASGDASVFVANLCGIRRTTTSSVQCTPATAPVGDPVTCASTVTDSDIGTAVTPTGTVAFTQGGAGTGDFDTDGTCTLAAGSAPGEATCSVTYTATSAGAQTLTGAFRGTNLSYSSADTSAHAATYPAPPTVTDGVSSAAVGEPQTFQVVVPAGGDVTLVGDNGPTTSVSYAGEGTYSLDTASGRITFTPVDGFAGTARSVRFRVTDTYGQAREATFTPTVVGPTPVAATATTEATTTPAGTTADPARAPMPAVCMSQRVVRVHFRVANGVKLRSLRVSQTGKATRSMPRKARRVVVDMRGYGAQTVRVQLRAKTTGGRTLTALRSYRTCAASSIRSAPGTLYLRAPGR